MGLMGRAKPQQNHALLLFCRQVQQCYSDLHISIATSRRRMVAWMANAALAAKVLV